MGSRGRGGVANLASHVDGLQVVFHGENLTVRGNYFHDKGMGTQAQGMLFSDGVILGLRVDDNLMHSMPNTMLQLGEQPDAVVMYNAIIGVVAIRQSSVVKAMMGNIMSSVSVFESASVTNEYGNVYLATLSGLTPDASSIVGTPTFVDSANGDDRLAAGSVGLGIGQASLAGENAPTETRLAAARPPWDTGSAGRG